MAGDGGGAGRDGIEIRLSAADRDRLAAAAPALGRIFEGLALAGAQPREVARSTSTCLTVLIYVAAGIIGSTTVLAGSVVAGLAAVLPAGGTAGLYEALYLRTFGAVLEALAWLLLATTVAVVLLQALRWLNKRDGQGRLALPLGGLGILLLLAVALWPGYRATEAAVCAAVALSLELPNSLPLENIEASGPFWCGSEFADWGLEPVPPEPDAEGSSAPVR